MTEAVMHDIEYPVYITLTKSGELEERICHMLTCYHVRSAPGNAGSTALKMNGGFDSGDTLRLPEGIVDICIPDAEQ